MEEKHRKPKTKSQSKKKARSEIGDQQYDASLKDWIAKQAGTILPILLPGVTYETTLNVELIRPPMRVDKVFKVRYHETECIAHFEFESGSDAQLGYRLLCYNGNLSYDYKLPVISMVVYPFRVSTASSPFCLGIQDENIVTFHFQVLPLFTLDAEQIVQKHISCMYPLLPTMKGVHTKLVAQVMRELAELYRDDEVTLRQQFMWLQLFLDRTDTVDKEEKQAIQKELNMFEQLWNESPRVQKMREDFRHEFLQEGLQKGRQEGLQEGRQEGRQEGEIKAFQRMLVNIVQMRFPELVGDAQEQARHIKTPEALELLIRKLIAATDANDARLLLTGEEPRN